MDITQQSGFLRILEVFTKEYKKETKYQEMVQRNVRNFRLNDDGESVEEKVERLTKSGDSLSFPAQYQNKHDKVSFWSLYF